MSLEILIREPKNVQIGSETLSITQIKTKHIPSVMRAALPIIGPLTEAAKGGQVDIASLLVEHSDAVLALVSICTGKSDEWVGELELDELIEVASAIVEVNALFFVERVLPAIVAKIAAVSAQAPLATSGQTASAT